MSEAKPTPGKWVVAKYTPTRVDTPSGSIGIVWASNCDDGELEREAEANARLIADAGTVHHKTGLTPSQLVARVSELEGVLREAIDCGIVPKSSVSDGGASKHSAQVRIADKIRSALAKSTEAK